LIIKKDLESEGNYPVYILISFIALFLSQLAVGSSEAEIIRGPYLSDATRTSMIVSWETRDASGSIVEYATDIQYNASGGVYDQQTEDSNSVKRHSITLRDLVPSTLYHYRVKSGADVGEDNTFHTAVERFEPFTLVAYGDTRTNANDHLAVVNRIIEHEPDLVLHSGDLVENGTVLSQWDVFFDTTKDLMKSVPFYPALGNHENNAQNYYDLFYPPAGGGKDNKQWYSFDYGNAHIICLDSDVRNSTDQIAWLEADLARVADRVQWIFVNFHHPPYSSGSHGSEYATMPKWIDAFERYGVDMVFNGHDHIYERSLSNDIWYIVTGGGGAPRYQVNQTPNPQQVYAEMTLHFCKLQINGAQLTFEMIRADGTVGDTFIMTEPVGVASVSRLPIAWGKIKTEGQAR
jgi:predicted phosphodiesterase